MRRCIEVIAGGFRLRGTVHVPPTEAKVAQSSFEKLGVILLHPGFLPRSGLGDIAVALADELANHGILCVRIDFPGLGDSEGDLPKDALTYVQNVQEGRFAEVASECTERIKCCLGLEKVVIAGHCGGAVTGFFSLALRKDDRVCGMIALDTPFNLILEAESTVLDGNRASFREKERVARKELYELCHRILFKIRLGGAIQKILQIIKKRSSVPVGGMSGSDNLPPETNRKLLKCVGQVLNDKIPVLFVTADDPRKPKNEFDYIEYLLKICYAGSVTHKKITGTDHAFLAGGGKQKMSACVTEWVAATFRSS
jgi:pimeloyl-ACP methyl ester carboxylesterase